MQEWLKSFREDVFKGIRDATVGKVVALVVTLAGVGVLTIQAVWKSVLSGHSEGLRLSVFGALVALNLWSLWLALRTVRVTVRPVSGANPEALLEVVNHGLDAEFFAGARVLEVKMESGEGVNFQGRPLTPSWLSSGTPDVIHLARNQAASLVLATSSKTPWTAPGVPAGVEWFRVKMQDAEDRGEVFPWLTKETIEIRVRVTVFRKKTPRGFRQPRPFVRDFCITGHPDWDLAVSTDSNFSFAPPLAAPPDSAASE